MSEGKYTKKYDPKTQEWIVRRTRTVPKQKPSEAFRRNYDAIDWSRPNDEQDEAGRGGGAKKDSEEEAEATADSYSRERSTQT